jgi:hypothetical protein
MYILTIPGSRGGERKMRYLRKRLTCVNRKTEQESIVAMNKVEKKYVDKMQKKGWTLSDEQKTEGNCMLLWERYITMIKK